MGLQDIVKLLRNIYYLNMNKCNFHGCDKPYCANGYCRTHNLRLYRHGDVNIVLRQETRTMDELKNKLFRFRKITEKGCWEWTRSRGTGGYGVLKHNKIDTSAHRASAFVFLDLPLDSEFCVLHHCDNPPCFNPDHLFVGTQKDNAVDMERKGRSYRTNFRGSMLPQAKLTEENVVEIKKLLSENVTGLAIAKKFNVGAMAISRIKNGKYWKHVV